MKIAGFVLVAMLVGCKGDPLRDDMKTFCRAADVKNSKSLVDIGPYVAERAKSKQVLDILVLLKSGSVTLQEVTLQFRELAAKAGLDECATLDILDGKRAPRPAD
jgi:hypothetical protein